ncbi:NifB/NifX family molybdenum-iron cluster-binding protein [Infirmifilum uzonense]|uniref:NifB/NifX family molybdenum-iron cluster-binding protein n=1 Tax=Infirmifilum uzonense TaxID=1550241 RepID=UPI003C7507A8
MKVAIATKRGGLDDEIADRFGRAPTFTIVEIDDTNHEIKRTYVVENPGSIAGSGAGIKAVQKLIEEGVSIAIGPNPGPNALVALESSGIRVYSYVGLKAREALEKVLQELRQA